MTSLVTGMNILAEYGKQESGIATRSALVTHRMTMAIGILNNIKNNTIPVFVKFREPRNGEYGLPSHTYYLTHDTGIPALDMILSYMDVDNTPNWAMESKNHNLVALVAARVIATHGWSQATSDAITVTWMATVGHDAFVKANGVEPSARMQFYNKGLEDEFIYNCSDWKEFI